MKATETQERFIEHLNACWQTERWDELAAIYHPDAILLPPDLSDPIRGRAAIIESYRNFAEQASLQSFSTPQIDCYEFACTKVVHARFRIAYRLGQQDAEDEGLEIYVLEQQSEAEAPVIVWRQQIVEQSRTLS